MIVFDSVAFTVSILLLKSTPTSNNSESRISQSKRRENFQEPREVLASPEGTSPCRDSPARASRG
ncbi:unnamed protein product [Clavelina lepadiformis]|uniref:Uncharacterized protein n=1 Tax=Clavelina lepadiformis TaxID=159417 RepID=A0ABP0FYR5_CLALP